MEDFDIEADKSVLRNSLSQMKKANEVNTSLDLKQYLDKYKANKQLTTTISPETLRGSVQVDGSATK